MPDNDDTFKAPRTYAELADASTTHKEWEKTLGPDYKALRHEPQLDTEEER